MEDRRLEELLEKWDNRMTLSEIEELRGTLEFLETMGIASNNELDTLRDVTYFYHQLTAPRALVPKAMPSSHVGHPYAKGRRQSLERVPSPQPVEVDVVVHEPSFPEEEESDVEFLGVLPPQVRSRKRARREPVYPKVSVKGGPLQQARYVKGGDVPIPVSVLRVAPVGRKTLVGSKYKDQAERNRAKAYRSRERAKWVKSGRPEYEWPAHLQYQIRRPESAAGSETGSDTG